MAADLPGDVLAVQIHMLHTVLLIPQIDLHSVQQRGHRPGVGRLHALPERAQPDGAVDRPGIHIEIAQFLRQHPGQGGLPRPGGPVDGDTVIIHASSPWQY